MKTITATLLMMASLTVFAQTYSCNHLGTDVNLYVLVKSSKVAINLANGTQSVENYAGLSADMLKKKELTSAMKMGI